MDENEYKENQENIENIENESCRIHYSGEHKWCNCKSDWVKCLMTGLLVFLGAFMAFYTLGDLYMKTTFNPMYKMHQEMNKLDRDFMREQRRFDRDIQRNIDHHRMLNEKHGIINMNQTDDNYRLVIDLKPFDNNEKNVNILVNGQTLTIDGAGISNTKNSKKMVKVSQTYVFDKNVKLNDMTKSREGNNLVITLPVDD